MERIIKSFFKLSINNNINRFNFNLFFNSFEKLLYNKLSSHGQLSFNDYLMSLKTYYNLKQLKQFTYSGKHSGINITIDDILKSVFYKRYITFNNKYNKNKTYKNMLSVYEKLMHVDNLSLTDKVIFVDRCIHLQHNSGFIVNLDINKIRVDIEG